MKLVASQRRTIRNDLAAILRRSTGYGEIEHSSFQVGIDATDGPLTFVRVYDIEDDYIEAMHAAYRAFTACNRTDARHIREFYADVYDALSIPAPYRTEEGKIAAHVGPLSLEDTLEPYCDDEFHLHFKFRFAGTTMPINGTEIVYLHQGKMYPWLE